MVERKMTILAVHELVGAETVFTQQVIRLDEAFLSSPSANERGSGA